MIVILTQDVKGKGKAGDVVKVNDGYARNMLIPKGLAKEATQGNVRSLEKQKALAEEKREEQKAARSHRRISRKRWKNRKTSRSIRKRSTSRLRSNRPECRPSQ